jgi:rubrerythrin
MYDNFAKIAKKEGYDNIAKLFKGVGDVEKFHESRYQAQLAQIKNGTVFKDTKEVYWWCMNCGTFIKGKSAPELCPVCSHPKGYFVRKEVKLSE